MRIWNFNDLLFNNIIGIINFNAEFNAYLEKKKRWNGKKYVELKWGSP